MSIPTADTPLYNHPLPNIEQVISQGCEQDSEQLHCWHIQRSDWQAELYLDIDQLTVRYIQAGKKDKTFNALQVFPQSARYRTGRFRWPHIYTFPKPIALLIRT